MTVDVCVPYWGDAATFVETIASVRAQTDPDWRLTIIDDDYPGTYIRDHILSLADGRITYRRNETNVGITENFRRAVDAARGSHVVVLGSDDLLLPGYVAHVKSVIAAHPDVDVIQPGVRVIDSKGRKARTLTDTVKLRLLTPGSPRTFHGEDMARSILTGNWLYWPSLVLRTDTVRRIGFRDGLPIILDLALLTDIALQGGSLHYTDVECFAYRRHPASLSQTALRDGSRYADERRFYREVTATSAAQGWPRAASAARWRIMSRLHALSTLPSMVIRGSSTARRATLALAFAS